MKLDRLFCAVLTAASCGFTTALKAEGGFEAGVYKSPAGESLNYRIHLPEKLDAGKKYPLVLFLHGAGERGDDNNKQLTHGAKDILAYSKKNDAPLILVAPQCPNGQQWVNTPWGADAHKMPEAPSDSMRLVMGMLQQINSAHPVDASRIYVTGLSMGGFGTWDIVQRMPDKIAAAMPVCGGGDTNTAAVIKDVPVWVFHGGSDGVVKTKRSRDMVSALKRAGSKVKYTEYEGVGHGSWGRAYSDQEALKWLFDQKKSLPGVRN